jgi:DNA processing protein
MSQARLRNLLMRFKTAEEVFAAQVADMTEIKGITQEIAHGIRNYRRSPETSSRIQCAREQGSHVCSFLDPDYPANLRTVDHAPPVLFMRGRIEERDRLALAIIGTRRADPYGMMVAQRFGRGMAEHGVTVVSGLARGIDTAAHIGALAGKGRTIAVLGCGVDVFYPPENRKLYDQIAESGAVVSEFSFGTKPEAFHFPVRNRVISGLSMAVLAVEARNSSGVLNTVRWALDQGREVLAVPGTITADTSLGTNDLIKDGARPVTRIEDLLEVLKVTPNKEGQKSTSGRREPRIDDRELSAPDRGLLTHLSENPTHIDDLAFKTGTLMPVLLSQLLDLEIRGVIRQLPGMMFVREYS